MTKKEVWKAYVKRNPSFDGDGNVTMSARGLRKMFDNTWEMAYESGFNQECEDDEPDYRGDTYSKLSGNDTFNSIFGTIFGKKN